MDDKALLDYFQSGGDLSALSDADLTKLNALTGGQGEQADFFDRTLRNLDTLGIPETAGGIVGGMVGGIPGAMVGAGGVNAVKNYFQGDSNLGETLLQGGLEGIMPGLGKVGRMLGGKMVRSVVPITEKAASTANPWATHKGIEQILGNLEEVPGIRAKTAFANVSDELSGVNKAATDLAASHGDMISTAIPQAAGRSGAQELPASIAKEIFSDSRFVEGASESGEKLIRDKAFKKALGSELKDQIPGMEALMKKQSTNIPLKEALDALLSRGGSIPFSEVVVSGNKVPRVLGIVKPPMFTTGRTLQRTGKAMQEPGMAGNVRGGVGLLELLAEILEPQPSH